METLASVLLWIAAVIATVLAATLAFDVVHWILHRLLHARAPVLQRLGELHGVHHRFLGTDLQVHEEWQRRNLFHHVLPEYATHLAFTLPLFFVLPASVVAGVLAIETAVVATILRAGGRDVNHRGWRRVPAHRPHLFCLPAYHAWHHVHPDAFLSSWIKPLDFALGTGAALRGRSAAVVEGLLGDALADALAGAGARVARLDADAEPEAKPLDGVELLVLSGAAVHAEEAWLEALCAARGDALLPPEVWVAAPEAGPVRPARRHLRDARFVYRRILVPEGGPLGLAARRAISRVLRGLRVVPLGPAPAALAVWLRAQLA